MTAIFFKEESYKIQGAIFEVYHEMGCGFLENVYQECLEKEFKIRNIPFISQSKLELKYKGNPLNHYYRMDFLCYGEIIVEIKAVSMIHPEHRAQVMNYLKATGFKLGLLANFGCYPKAVIQRIVM